MDGNNFPPFSLSRLLRTTFQPVGGERVAILIDLPDPGLVKDFAFLTDESLTIQHHAHREFYLGLRSGVLQELDLAGGELFAYQETGGSNLDLPEESMAPDGSAVSLQADVYPKYDIILCVSTWSATAPLTASARQFGFRGATLHGLNKVILSTGLSVDYNQVSRDAEKLRLGLTRADYFEIDFLIGEKLHSLRVDCGRQEAQKSHGLCPPGIPDVANLPAGEIFFVPNGAEGEFPMYYEDGTIGLMEVTGGRAIRAGLLSGSQQTIDTHNKRLTVDPVTGKLGELGFGTQELPVSGRDIQDEKILGTLHVATGRSDHLGGDLTPDKFATAQNATHDDILFAPHKTPSIGVPQVRMFQDGRAIVVLEDFQPAPYLRRLLAS